MTVYESYNQKRKSELLHFYEEIYKKNKAKAQNALENLNEKRTLPEFVVPQTVMCRKSNSQTFNLFISLLQ